MMFVSLTTYPKHFTSTYPKHFTLCVSRECSVHRLFFLLLGIESTIVLNLDLKVKQENNVIKEITKENNKFHKYKFNSNQVEVLQHVQNRFSDWLDVS